MVAQVETDLAVAQVIVLGEAHAMLANISPGQRRLSEYLNDPARRFIPAEQIKTYRSDRMDLQIGQFESAKFRRDSIRAILVMEEPERPSQQRLANYLPKRLVKVSAVTPDLQIVGTIHSGGKLEPVEFVFEGPDPFAIFSTAVVTMACRPDTPLHVPTVFVNRAHIEMVSLVQ
jgi:hypothetical protein